MKTYKAPELIIETAGKLIFLAGTIDMGNSINWQEQATNFFKDKVCTILNPRRDDWDSSREQSEDKTQFDEQVNWELDAMKMADLILVNFLAGSQSPVTLLELGLHAASGKLLVCCPDGFWRSGNVEIICKRYQIPFYRDLHVLLNSIRIPGLFKSETLKSATQRKFNSKYSAGIIKIRNNENKSIFTNRLL